MTHRAYKYRCYPTPEQAQSLARTFGCCRFVYNYFLAWRRDNWEVIGKGVSAAACSRELTRLKAQPGYEWLNGPSYAPLQQSLADLDKAFSKFFKNKKGYPSFKKRSQGGSFRLVGSGLWAVSNLAFKLPKDHSELRLVRHRPIPEGLRITSATVNLDTAGRYWVSLLVDDPINALVPADSAVGVDVGLNSFAALSTGEKILGPKAYKAKQDKLALLQRRLSKKKKNSSNRNKARLKVARLHAKISNVRKDFAHKLSTRLIRENQTICLETLTVSSMIKNRRLAKSIADASWSSFTSMLEYKAKWYGRTVVRIDKWEPSSKRCNECGDIVKLLPLKVRKWACPSCGAIHDRDENAAKNILAAGLAVLACGETVRLAERKVRKAGSMKQELPGANE